MWREWNWVLWHEEDVIMRDAGDRIGVSVDLGTIVRKRLVIVFMEACGMRAD